MQRKVVTTSGPAKFILFQPGNGTKYETIFVPVPDLCDDDNFLFCWSNPLDGPGRCISMHGARWNNIHSLSYIYFMDKMQCSVGDAAALLSLIHETTDREIEFPPGFGSDGLLKPAKGYS